MNFCSEHNMIFIANSGRGECQKVQIYWHEVDFFILAFISQTASGHLRLRLVSRQPVRLYHNCQQISYTQTPTWIKRRLMGALVSANQNVGTVK